MIEIYIDSKEVNMIVDSRIIVSTQMLPTPADFSKQELIATTGETTKILLSELQKKTRSDLMLKTCRISRRGPRKKKACGRMQQYNSGSYYYMVRPFPKM